MKAPHQSIVAKYVLVVSLSLLAVSAAGIWSGSALLSDMAALSDDARFMAALKAGRNSIIEFRDHRNALLERMVAKCVQRGEWPQCDFLGLRVEVAPEGRPPTAWGWESDDAYVTRIDQHSYRLKIHWAKLKGRYQDISDVINTRDHLTEVFPRVQRSFIAVFTLSIGGIGCCGVAAVYLLSRRLRRRVRDLTTYADQIAAGELLPAPVATSGGDEIGLLSASMEKMAKDLFEAKEKLIFAQKMQSWQAVARKVAHEIKNPLTPITIVAEQLQRSQKHAEPQLQATLAEASRILYEEAGALSRMVQEFTAFARLPNPQLEPIDAVSLVKDFVARNERAGGPTFTIRSAVDSCRIMADRGMLMQILHNLVNNSALAKAPKTAAIDLVLSATDQRLILDVGDDGPGVPTHLRATLFDAYVTSRSTGDGEKGMGLGLTISRKIAADHGGALHLLQTGPTGTVFRLELPKAVFTSSPDQATLRKGGEHGARGQ